MNRLEIFKKEIETCNIHCIRIEAALVALEYLLPLTGEKIDRFSTTEFGLTDLLTNRFAKLQDTIGEKIFKDFLYFMGEHTEKFSFIDILNRLEKLEFLPSTQVWLHYRNKRNSIAHEYPDNPSISASNLNEIIDLARELVTYWKFLRTNIDEKILNNEAYIVKYFELNPH